MYFKLTIDILKNVTEENSTFERIFFWTESMHLWEDHVIILTWWGFSWNTVRTITSNTLCWTKLITKPNCYSRTKKNEAKDALWSLKLLHSLEARKLILCLSQTFWNGLIGLLRFSPFFSFLLLPEANINQKVQNLATSKSNKPHLKEFQYYKSIIIWNFLCP